MIEIGIIGCGFIGTIHSRAIKGVVGAGLVDASVVATCDVDLERARASARPHGAALATTDPHELLDAVDAVWICTPTSSHRGLVEAAAAAGVALLCEKPLATSLEDAEAMAAAVAAAGIPAQVGLVLRTAPAYQAVVDLVRSGSLGRPMAVVFRDDQFLPVRGHYASTWRGEVSIAGGGTLLEHSIHDVDVLSWLLGEVTSVSARTAAFAALPGIEDVAVVTLTYASGAVATLASVWHQVLTRPSTRSLEVICEDGIVAVTDEYTGPLTVTTDAGIEERACPYPDWVDGLGMRGELGAAAAGYAPQARAFLDALAAGRPPAPGLGVAVAAHRIAAAAYRSAADGGAPTAP
ncbi:MAG TPA: Gfo/Idh/MocA family oxidoreductase [Acidimicrobiales bacterium]|nr:Gfo/Idh/MocA family oxidoreductase [Acidimicrobiales bacterium]